MQVSLSLVCVFTSLLACSESSGLRVSVPQTPTLKCPKGRFLSHDSCVPCKRCDFFSAEVAACNKTSDTVCQKCLKDTGIPNKVFKNPTCKKLCRPCGPGMYVKKACKFAKKQKTKCEKCQKGSFSAMTSYAPYCVPCTDCGNMEVVSPCTATTDSVCGACKPGFYRDSGRNMCFKCHSCLPGQQEIDECRGGVEGKMCSGFYFRNMQMRLLNLEDKEKHYKTTASTSQTTTTSNSTPMRDLDVPRSALEDTGLTTLILVVAVTLVTLLIALITALAFKLTALTRRQHVTRLVQVLTPETPANVCSTKPVFSLDNCKVSEKDIKLKETKEKFIELWSEEKILNIRRF